MVRKKSKIIKNYIKDILDKYPKISSGRKNYDFYDKRIIKNIDLLKKFINKKKSKT